MGATKYPIVLVAVIVLGALVAAVYLVPQDSADPAEGPWRPAEPPKPKDLPALMETATAPDWEAREQAVGRIGMLGNDQAVRFLIRVLREDSAPQVRAAAAESLGRLRAEDAADGLMEALRDPSLIVRARAGAAMSQLVGGIDVHYRADDPADKRDVAIGKFKYLWEKVRKWQEESGEPDKG
jgi:HEAT repeat protein